MRLRHGPPRPPARSSAAQRPVSTIKTARTGFTHSQAIHHLCEGLGVEVVIGNQIDSQIGSACNAAFGAAYEATSRRAGELSNFLDMADDLLTEPLVIKDGTVLVRQGAGLGIDIDEDKLRHYRHDGSPPHNPPICKGPGSPWPRQRKRRSTIMSITQDSPTAAGPARRPASRSRPAWPNAVLATSAERVATVVTAVLHAIHDVISEHDITYPEYQAAKAWMIEVGETGEWPLFLDVFVEHAVEEAASRTQHGTKGTIEGPYYLPGQVRLGARAPSPAEPARRAPH